MCLGGMFMGETFEISESKYEDIKDLPYDKLVKILAVLTIVEEEGLTPAVWEKWGAGRINGSIYALRFQETIRRVYRMGRYQKKLYTMLNTTYPNFVSDFNKEYSKQKIALQLVELRLETGLSQSRYAEENQLLQNKISAIEKGKTNPRLSTIIEMAAKNGYKVELKFTK